MVQVAIMQPYFFPFIGYFQLINSVDIFVIYDDIKFTKRGWINRNRISTDNGWKHCSLELQKSSDGNFINEKKISPSFSKQKMIGQLRGSYGASYTNHEFASIFETLIDCSGGNLFDCLYSSTKAVCQYLEIDTKIVKSSQIGDFVQFKSEQKVINICKSLGARQYLNAENGQDLYSHIKFKKHKISLNFLCSRPREYKHIKTTEFQPNLSILDLIFCLEKKVILEILNHDFFVKNGN